MALKVLITGCGSEGARGIIQTLRAAYGQDIWLGGFDTNQYIANQNFLDFFRVPPKRNDPSFLPFVMEVLRQEKIDVLWPIPTMELELFAANKEKIESLIPACKVMIGSLDSIRTANSKILLYESVRSYLPECAPDFIKVNNVREMEEAIFKAGYPEKKVCIKKEIGAGGLGLRILDAAADRGDILLNSSSNRICRWEDLVPALKEIKQLPPYMVVEYLPGEEWDCDILCYKGRSLSIVTRKNIQMAGGMATVTEIQRNSELEDYCLKIVENLGSSYIWGISFKQDQAGQYKLLEINPRVPGTIISCFFAGLNVAPMALDLLRTGREPEGPPLMPPPDVDIIISRINDAFVLKTSLKE